MTVGGLDLSGYAEADARRLLEERLGGRFGGVLTVHVGGREFRAAYAEIGRALDVDATRSRSRRPNSSQMSVRAIVITNHRAP